MKTFIMLLMSGLALLSLSSCYVVPAYGVHRNGGGYRVQHSQHQRVYYPEHQQRGVPYGGHRGSPQGYRGGPQGHLAGNPYYAGPRRVYYQR